MISNNLRIPLVLAITGLIIWACQTDTSIPEPQDTNEIENLLENYYSTMSDRDWKKYKTFFIDHANLTTIWEAEGDSTASIHNNSISDFIAKTKDGPDSQPIFEERMISSEITLKQNLASAWVFYEAKFGTEENLMEWQGNDLFSFIKHNGHWRISSLVFESIH